MTITPARVHARLDSLAKPPGSLGQLEALAVELAMAQGTLTPLTHPRRLVLFAADHGVVAQGVTPWPQSVTTAMVATILSGRASSTALAAAHDVDVRVVDAGMAQPPAGPFSPHYRSAPVASGTADLAAGPAMDAAQFDAAWALGASEAEAAVTAGFRLLIA